MQPDLESTMADPLSDKPILDSYDSGEEFSFFHWMELRKLVEDGDRLEIEETIELMMSEVQSSATDQHFSGHVIGQG